MVHVFEIGDYCAARQEIFKDFLDSVFRSFVEGQACGVFLGFVLVGIATNRGVVVFFLRHRFYEILFHFVFAAG